MQGIKIVSLHDHIVKFKEGQTLVPPFLITFRRQHMVHRKMRAHLSQQVHIIQAQQPVAVIYHQRFAIGKINELAHLLFEAFNVVVDKFRRQHLAHIVLAAGVADHTGAAAQQCDGTVPRPLHMGHSHQSNKVTDMQTVRRRVKSNIKRNLFLLQHFPNFILMGNLCDKTTFLQHIKNRHRFKTLL